MNIYVVEIESSNQFDFEIIKNLKLFNPNNEDTYQNVNIIHLDKLYPLGICNEPYYF